MNKMMNLIVTASAALVMSGAAMAQNLMTANVPFEFEFGGRSLPAGQYRVDTSRAAIGGTVVIQNSMTKETGISIALPGGTANSMSANRSYLAFRCGASGCVLTEVSTPAAEYKYNAPKMERPQFSASIPLTRATGE